MNLALSVVILTGLIACADLLGPGSDSARVWVGETNVILEVGEQGRLTARYIRDRRSSVDSLETAEWRSGNPAVISVEADGTVRALSPGVAAVWLEYEGARDSANVAVVESTTSPGGDRVRWVAVAVGDETTCALTAGRRTYCWGGDYFGALGDGVRRQWTHAHAPVAIVDAPEFVSLGVGLFQACGLTPAGTVYCWGDGGVVLGDRFDGDHVLSPRRVEFATPFSQLSVGDNHMCALDEEGAAYCWGVGASGELGDAMPGIHHRSQPHRVTGDQRYVQVLAGHYHTCALGLDGSAYCWGLGGTLGDGTMLDRAVPGAVAGQRRYEVLTGRGHTCGRDSGGVQSCWGSDAWQEIGTSEIMVLEPIPLAADKQFDRVTAGFTTTCGTNSSEGTQCWGSDRSGNLGRGEVSDNRCGLTDREVCDPNAGPIDGGHSFEQVSLAGSTSCGITVEGALYCWGSNSNGQLGDGSLVEYSATPVRVAEPR